MWLICTDHVTVLLHVYRELGGKVGREGEYLTFEGSYFRNGFMYKLFNMNAIVSGGWTLVYFVCE